MSMNYSLKHFVVAVAFAVSSAMPAVAETWVVKDSASDVSTTVEKLTAAAENAGATVFAVVDHAAGARSIDAALDDMTLVIFGNPRLGTPILQASPRAGLDLPIRVLIWDDGGQTKIGYLDPAELKTRYGVDGADGSFEMMAGALMRLTDAAAQ